MFDCIIAAIGEQNVDVYTCTTYEVRSISNGNNGSIQADVVKKLAALGISVKFGNVYRIPENPVMPLEEDFPDNVSYGQAMKDFYVKLSKCNNVQGLIENGSARKVVMIENLAPVSGYVMVSQEKETSKAKPKIKNNPETPTDSASSNDSEESESKIGRAHV